MALTSKRDLLRLVSHPYARICAGTSSQHVLDSFEIASSPFAMQGMVMRHCYVLPFIADIGGLPVQLRGLPHDVWVGKGATKPSCLWRSPSCRSGLILPLLLLARADKSSDCSSSISPTQVIFWLFTSVPYSWTATLKSMINV